MILYLKHIAFWSFIVGLFIALPQKSIAQEPINDTIKKFTIENCVNQFSETNTVETKAGYQYWFVDKEFLDGRTLKMSVVAPNESTHAPHKHSEDEFFFILEGTAQFYLNGETRIVEAYTSLYCPSNSMHGISNAGNKELKYLVIKKYQNK
jgi:mannose-6-phosphate isomerase-like protein (cupin superfamily)